MSKMRDTVKFSSKEMNKYMAEFAPINYKYFGCNQIPDWAKEKMRDVTNIEQADSTLAFSKVTSNDLVHVYKIAEAVYADSKRTKEYVDLYTIVQEKFVEQFVGIKGMDELYQPLFFVFEWMMHLEYQPEKDTYSYYRDHFVHQVRNMFEMFMIFSSEDLGILKGCVDFFERDHSLLARYVRTAVDKEYSSCECLRGLNSLYDTDSDEGKTAKRISIYRFLLLASIVVTSLIHDIGYPIQFLNNNLKRIEGFLPISNYFIGTRDKTSEIYTILQDSWLFQTVDFSEIRKLINKGDHGTISACTLLLKYYLNGKIHAMNPIQSSIIELSALTIYNHTLRYRINGKDAKLYQNVYEDNPFSFWFRVCDDIEEWDRVYFDITKQSNFLICENCKTVIRKISRSNHDKKQYYCCCGKKGKNDNLFKYRKLAHVNACDEVSLENRKQDKKVIIFFHYDLMALLQASSYNAQFAFQRSKGIVEIKKMVFSQSGYVPIYVDTFISGNPVAIKTEIMLRYIDKKCENGLKPLLEKWDNMSLMDVVKNCFEIEDVEAIHLLTDIEQLMKLWYGRANAAYEVLKENLLFYGRMALLAKYLKPKEPNTDLIGEVDKVSTYICSANNVFLPSLRDLIRDCVRQAVYHVSYEQFQIDRFKYKDYYFKMQKASLLDVDVIESYIKSELYDLVRLRCEKKLLVSSGSSLQEEVIDCVKYGINLEHCKLDFYSDFYAFSQLNAACNKVSDGALGEAQTAYDFGENTAPIVL